MSSPPPPSHGMQLDVEYPGLPALPHMTAGVQQLKMPHTVPANANKHMTSGDGITQQQRPNDGFVMSNVNRMARKMSTMKITGKATGCGLRAASPLAHDVFAKKFHNDTTEQELLDYLNANNITPKSVHVVSHEQARTKSFKICCDRENFVKCFNENLWPDSIEIRKYNPPVRSARLLESLAH